MVREGMVFILGYKRKNIKPVVKKLQKQKDVDEVKVVQLSYIFWVTDRIPTNDEFNIKKIIRIFITDLNRSIYKINDVIKDKLLSLPE